MSELLLTESWFDGRARHAQGPYAMLIDAGRIEAIARGADAGVLSAAHAGTRTRRAAFAMPGLVEAHAHVFLDGDELDAAARARFLEAPRAAMLEVARRNLSSALRHGITLIRDAGDRYGVNHALRDELRDDPRPGGASALPGLRSPGAGIRRPGRYGGFIAQEAADDAAIVAAVHRIADSGADDLKIILTGIIDFASGTVKGEPQFDERSLALLVRTARGRGLKTFAHCSGQPGLEAAVAGGVDSIEHGFFMSREILARMAEKGIAWVPTFSPVHFQWAHPEHAGWNAATVARLRQILDAHLEHVALAHRLGVDLVAGSDAGSPGVSHGRALLGELLFFLEAGVPLAAVLESATSRPRRLWNTGEARVRPGAPADLVLLAGDPFEDRRHLLAVTSVLRNGCAIEAASAAA